jgi:hypothetical protein
MSESAIRIDSSKTVCWRTRTAQLPRQGAENAQPSGPNRQVDQHLLQQKLHLAVLRTTNPIERLNKEFKRRTRAMEVTGGEILTYRCFGLRLADHGVPLDLPSLPQSSTVYTHVAARLEKELGLGQTYPSLIRTGELN